MSDLDNELRAVARALVAEAPAPPSFADAAPMAAVSLLDRRRPVAALALTATAAAMVAAVAVVGRSTDSPPLVTATVPPSSAPTCGTNLPFEVTVLDAVGGPVAGPAPGSEPAAPGQFVQHWRQPGGTVELRWPATPPPVYAERPAYRTPLTSGTTSTRGRVEIDVAPPKGTVPPSPYPDLVVHRGARLSSSAPPACDVVDLAMTTDAGRWRSGLRVTPDGSPSVYEPVDLEPTVAERRPVDVAPREAIACTGRDHAGTPPNRTGGPHPDMRGALPHQALLSYLAATPGAPQTGYVELAAADGSITYGVEPSGDGWTTLVTVVRDDAGWHVHRWTASGC